MTCISEKSCIAVMGLGYVGLPLAVAFVEKYQTIGFDINKKRVEQLSNDNDALAAAGTKWNFLPFKPGLVCGHCIGVDPYYLAHKAERIGYRSEVILAGRRINDSMSNCVAGRIVKFLLKMRISVATARILVLGIPFKENYPDTRNSKVVDMIKELQDFGLDVDVYDPLVDKMVVRQQYGKNCLMNSPLLTATVWLWLLSTVCLASILKCR